MSPGSFGLAWVHWCAAKVRRLQSGSRGLIRARLVVVGFIWRRVVSLRRTEGSSGSFGLAWVYFGAHSGRRVHPGSLGFTRAHIWVVGFIGVRECTIRLA